MTSNLDGLIKWPLIVSQVAIVGGIFSHLFLWEQFGNKIARKNDDDDDGRSRDLHWLKRFTIMLVAASVTIVASASSSLFLQITELSGNSYYSYISIFTSILHGSSGIWLMHTATSIIVITCSVSFYYLSKRDNGKRIFQKNKPERVLSGRSPTSSLLYVALVAGALSIFANSISSHNAGVNFLPSLAISLDWLHFMAVSMWVGGLFYISAGLLATIRASSSVTPATETEDLSQRTSPSNKASNIEKKMTETSDSATYHYYLALLLPRFSLIATVSLGIIGVSGIYMAWIQLQNINALFNTNYGNILIIKLAAALPLVLLGAYHQLRLHRSVVRVASSGRVGSTMQITQSFDHDSEDEPSKGTVGRKKEINNNSNSKKNDISKFDKTIKIESLLAITVLLVASLLTITSPHPMDMSHMGMMSSTSSSSSPSVMNMTGMQTSVKNSTYVKQVSIMNINTKIEINPFYTGFNIFKIAFTDANGKPNTKVSSAELIFRNEQKDIGPIVVNLHTGTSWNIFCWNINTSTRRMEYSNCSLKDMQIMISTTSLLQKYQMHLFQLLL